MIPNIANATVSTASKVYSILGNGSSLVPLAIKDVANSCGLTAASYLSGDSVEGKDRFIDEFGTQAIWLLGIPAYKKVIDLTMYKPLGFDSKVDARILKNPEILKAAEELAPTEVIKNSIKNVAAHQSKYRALTVAKFAASTLLTCASYFGLTKFRHKYTENQIKKDYFEKQDKKLAKNNKNIASPNIQFSSAFDDVNLSAKPSKTNKKGKNVNFTGGMQDFIFDPVKNLMIVDGAITGERLAHSRNPQDFLGYVIKEGSFWAFMYFAGDMIANALEKNADKKGKSIDLDARVIESPLLKQSFQDGSLKSHLETFNQMASKSDVELYKYAVQSHNENLVLDMAKKSDIIAVVKDSDSKLHVDTRKYIDLDKLKGVGKKLEKLLGQYENSGECIDEFFKTVRKAKRSAIRKNIGACIGALGVLAPITMLVTRKLSPDSGYQVKKDVEAKLDQQQNNNKSKVLTNS